MMPSFKTKVIGCSRPADRSEIRRALSILIDPACSFQLQALPSGKWRVCRGDDLDRAVETAVDLSDEKGCYYSINPCKHDCGPVRVPDMVYRRWLLIDVDSVAAHERGDNATDAEATEASDTAIAIWEYLGAQGLPDPLCISSGNGAHLLYRIDLPNDKLSQQVVRQVLSRLAGLFDTAGTSVGVECHNANRIAKLPGTWARKGPDSPEHPHRMARLVLAPDPIGVVSIDQLQALIREGESSHPGAVKSPFSGMATGGSLAGYVRSAIERECGRVLLTPQGERNTALNRSAFSLGTMAGWPEMAEPVARGALQDAALKAGLDEAETTKTIASGWTAGAASPRARPVDPSRNGAAPKPAPKLVRLTIGLHEVKPEKVDWLWEGRVAIGFITMFAGRTGHAKSFVMCDVAARLSRGDPTPCSTSRRDPAGTLIVSEDPLSVMLAPRLNDLKADPRRIRFMTWEAMARFTLDDIDMLTLAWEESGRPALIVIDPPANFLGAVDEHRNAEVRRTLMKLVEWLDRNRVACVLITHLNKAVGKGLDAVERMMGSVAWGSVARVVIAFAKDPDNPQQFLCGVSKTNLGEPADPLAFKIERADDRVVIDWIGRSDTSMEDALAKIPKKSRGANAVEWLIGMFTGRREWESSELRKLAAEAGISKNALFESPEVLALPIRKRKRVDANGEVHWFWIADENWPQESWESWESSNASSETTTDIEGSQCRKRKDEISGIFTDQESSIGPIGVEEDSQSSPGTFTDTEPSISDVAKGVSVEGSQDSQDSHSGGRGISGQESSAWTPDQPPPAWDASVGTWRFSGGKGKGNQPTKEDS